MTDQAPANWYPDPFARYEHRYWDGGQWTHHVATQGTQAIDAPVAQLPPIATPSADFATKGDKRVQRQVRETGVVAGTQSGGGTLLTEPVLVVNQKAKLIEVNVEYKVFNQHGQRIGAIREVGQNLIKKAAGVDTWTTRKFQMVDLNGQVVISLIAPVSLLKAKVIVKDATRKEVDQIVQKGLGIPNARFALMSDGQAVGSINGEGWASWNFSIQNANGTEVARITKKWAGFSTELFSNVDNYVVEIDGSLEHPLRTLVVAAALVIDTGLRQGTGQSQDRADGKATRAMRRLW